MSTQCATCGFSNPSNFKFCGNCGAALNADSSRTPTTERLGRLSAIPSALAEKIALESKRIEGERRQVTVLFADVSGFTSISEKLDPEQVYEIADAVTKAFVDQIYAHEGTLDKFMGDGVMALFGAPVAHEDDPARAVRAALEMQDALRKIAQDFQARLNIPLKVRIGLNTGTVIVGSVGSDLRMDYTAIGDTVNVASRLQSVAEPGTILVSRSLYDLTQPLFHFRELGSIRVKGRVEPVEIFEALSPRETPGRARGIPGLAAPMVGRDTELAVLNHAVERVLTHRHGQMVLVTGDAGLGKSRLKSEARKFFQYQPLIVLEGAALSYGQSPYSIFLQLLKPVFELSGQDSAELLRDKIERVVRRVLPEPNVVEVLPYLLNLFSIPIVDKELGNRIRHLEPAMLQQQTFLAVRDFLGALAAERPLVLIFEDIHWIDQISLDLLCFLIESLERVPVLLYCNARPTEGGVVPKILELGKSNAPAAFHHIALSPLSHADSMALMDLLLSIAELPEELKQMIPDRAEGNPYYLEEIIRMLIDRGIIHRAEGRWEMTPGADVRGLEVPGTLQGLIMARADGLPEGSRHALQCASVIGRDFSYRLLSQVVDDPSRLHEQVGELEDRELINRVMQETDIGFRFHHVLIQDTVYRSLLKKRREYLHEKIAQTIEQLYWDQIEERVEQLAFHYAESQNAERALPYLLRAGKRAAARYANDQALGYYTAAADFLSQTNATPEQRGEIYAGLGEAQFIAGHSEQALVSFQSALDALRLSHGEATRAAELMNRIGRVYERQSDATLALEWLNRALDELARDPGSERAVERALTYNNIGWVHYRQGHYEDAYQWRMKSLQIIEGTEHYTEIASAYNGLVAIFGQKGDWKRCLAYAEKGLHLREMIGDRVGVSQSHTNLGSIASGQCNWDQAIYHYARSLEIKEQVGDIAGIARLSNNLGSSYREKGDYARATQLCEQALETAEKIKHDNLVCFALNNLAHIQLQQREFDVAFGYASRCLETANRIKSKEHNAEAHWLSAEAHLGRGEIDLARTHAQQAVDIASSHGLRLIQGQALRTLGKIARAQKQFAQASDYVQRSLTIFSELENPFELARSQYLLGMLLFDQGKIPIASVALDGAMATFARLGARGEDALARAELTRLNILIPNIVSQ